MSTLETIDLVKLIADVGLSVFLAIVLLNTIRGANRSQIMMIDIVGKLSGNISASTKAITDLKDCEDETQTIVTGFRREVQSVHGTQLEGIKAIQDYASLLPGMAAAVGRIEPGLVEIRAAVESARDIAAKTALSLDGVLNRLDALRSHPVTPGRSIEASAERVRVLHEAREQMATADASRKTGEQAAVVPGDGVDATGSESRGG